MDGRSERMAFWPVLSYINVFNFSVFYPSELGSKNRSDYKPILKLYKNLYKNCKAYSYYKSGWLQPMQY